jgi:hypothetical protein
VVFALPAIILISAKWRPNHEDYKTLNRYDYIRHTQAKLYCACYVRRISMRQLFISSHFSAVGILDIIRLTPKKSGLDVMIKPVELKRSIY